MSDPSELDRRSRPELIEDARRVGVERPERMTRVELKDEILRRTKTGADQAEARGLFGVARSMLASVVETGLHLPDAAALIRGTATFDSRVVRPAPVATVTLAEIYAVQGHKKRALGMLDEVLEQEPDHEVALRLRRELGDDGPTKGDSTFVPEQATEPASALVETSGIDVTTAEPPPVAETESLRPSTMSDWPEVTGGEGEAAAVDNETAAIVREAVSAASEAAPFEPDPAVEESEAAPFEPDSAVEESEAAPDSAVEESEAAPDSAVGESEAASDSAVEESEAAPVESESPQSHGPASAPTSAGLEHRPNPPLVVLGYRSTGPILYWQLDVSELTEKGFCPAGGQLALHAAAFWPGRTAPVREERSVLLDSSVPGEAHGTVSFQGWEGAMTVRAALGWQASDQFIPLAVAVDIEKLSRGGIPLELSARLVTLFE